MALPGKSAAGTGSVAAWLLERVGPQGQVVATDVEKRWLEPMSRGRTSRFAIARRCFRPLGGRRLRPDPRPPGPRPPATTRRRRRQARGGVAAGRLARRRGLRPPHDGADRAGPGRVGPCSMRASSRSFGGQEPTRSAAAGCRPSCSRSGWWRRRGRRFRASMTLPELAPIFRPALERLWQPLLSSRYHDHRTARAGDRGVRGRPQPGPCLHARPRAGCGPPSGVALPKVG